jgi:glycosyltransferase involved in cell wall biosynthesis
MPFCVEMPSLLFTIQSVINELDGLIDYEILAVDNTVDSIPQSQHRELNGGKYLRRKVEDGVLPNVRLLEYKDKLSHWNAKNLGIRESTGDLLFFLDAHCVVYPSSLRQMIFAYTTKEELSHGSIHLPLSYLANQKDILKYDLVADVSNGVVSYKFAPFTPSDTPELVPCMSTCGMLIRKDIMTDVLRGWPSELGVYSGGEYYFNFALAVMGYKKHVFNSKPLQHYAAPRAYEMEYYDIYRNRAIATFLFGGREFFDRYIYYYENSLMGKVSPRKMRNIGKEIPTILELANLREHIRLNTIIDIEDWVREQRKRA